MFVIFDGRECFYQWDQNQRLIVLDKTITEVHFCNRTDDCALIVEVKEVDGVRVADVPNILLTDNFPIKVYGYCGDCFTKTDATFKVVKRSKPSDYIYTETEVKNYEDFEARIKALEEKEVDLTDYVKNTDYATDKKGGVIKTDTRYGTRVVDGILDICAANANVIDGRTPITNPLYSASAFNRHPIVAGNLDYAVKAALSNSKLEWTGEEKAAAIDLLGGLKKFTVQGNAGDKVYVAKADGTQGTAFIGNSAYQMARYIDESTGGTSPKGYLLTATPLKNYQAANKKYVDDTIATLIERIVALEAIVEELTGGGGNSDFSEGLAFVNTLDGSDYSLAGRGTCADTIIIVPSEYNGKPVTRCEDYALANDALIEEVYLPSTLTDTGSYFCNNCPNLRIIHLLGVTSFNSFGFGGLTSLEYVKFGNISWLGGGIFCNCNNTVYDFSENFTIPTLDSYGAGSEFGANPTIKVPANLYDIWIAAEGWSNYADCIVGV